jgi:hypothetical protein
MDQSQRDTAAKAAWITGGFALEGTLVTALFTSGTLAGFPAGGAPSPVPASSSTAYVGASSVVSSTPPPVTPTPTPLVPEGVEGHWKGGGAVSENFHLTIANDASWTLINGNDVQAAHVAEGKVVFDGAQATFYYADGRAPLVVDWALVKTPTTTVLHLGTYTYTK